VKETAGKRELLLCLLLSIAFSVFVCFVSDRILNRQARRAEAIEMELAILNGQPFHESGNLTYMPAFQNRLLFPVLLKLGSILGVFSLAGWYVFWRLFTALAMFFAFSQVLRSIGAGIKLTGAGMLSLAYCLVFTFSLPLVLTSDFPDAMFTCLFVLASLQRKRWLLLVLAVIAAANRESAAFAGVIWFFIYGLNKERRIDLRESGFAALVSICSYATALLLRYELGGWQAINSHTQLLALRTNLFVVGQFLQHPLSPFTWLGLTLCMITPFVLWIFLNRQVLTFVQKRVLLAAGTIALASLIFGIISELRIFIPSIVLLLIVSVWAETTAALANASKTRVDSLQG
jgi:hypothetical protein